MRNSTFERFASCGSIIRNFRNYYVPDNLKPVSSGTEVYYFRSNTLQREVFWDRDQRETFDISPFDAYC